jgi:drug/metabolite transporter (DMT)-like permease
VTVAAEAMAPGRPAGRQVDGGLLLVILLFSVGPPTLKLITAPALLVAMMRTLFASPLIWLVACRQGGRLSRDLLRRTLAPGLFWAVNTVTILAAFGHTTIAIVTVFQALQPAVVLVTARLFLGEAFTRTGAAWTAVGVAGVSVVVLGGDAAVRGDTTGLLLCTVALFSYSGYYLLNRRERANSDMTAFEFLGGATLVATVVLVPVALLGGAGSRFGALGWGDWALLVFVAVFVNTVAHGVMSWLHGHLTAGRSSMVLPGCNVGAILIAWPLLDEPVTPLQGLGCLITFIAVAAVLRTPTVHPLAAAEPLPAT